MTKQHKPATQLLPATARREVFDCLKDVFKITGDIESPVEPAENWEALRLIGAGGSRGA